MISQMPIQHQSAQNIDIECVTNHRATLRAANYNMSIMVAVSSSNPFEIPPYIW